MILAAKPYLPPKDKYEKYVADMWESGWLTNNSVFVQTLEKKLADYLSIPNISVLNNGTFALQLAIKALGLKGEIITTPFSYVATTSSIIWEGCKPVFVDIEEGTYSINASLIEAAITDKTTAILCTHVYGNPCEVDAIGKVAEKHGLKVVYDAAHAFGVQFNGESILHYGDVSTLSFHATKLFHTVEGGAVVSTDPEIANIMEYQRRFGHDGPYAFHGIGVNAKLSEPHAAFGLCVLEDIDEILETRKQQWQYYEKNLKSEGVQLLLLRAGASYNYAYFPLQLNDEATVLRILAAMESEDIYPRRYFYPSLNLLEYVNYRSCPISEYVAPRILCLPMYHNLALPDRDRIIEIVKRNL